MQRLSTALSDRYVLERELGAGGMATVYLAQDLKHDRRVAVKVLRPELAAVIGADRFLSEIKTTANLQHPHILPLFDSGAADGFLFYVMPFVQGETVRDRITREKQLPIADAVRIATEVASALDYAHRHGVIHRDIKPENILLHDGSALVADFGIALAASKVGGSRMTETGMSLGTPQYMSPEQAMGEREITARSDVYALGCVLYEMLTGDPPFTGSTAQAIVARVVTETPRPMAPQRHTIPPNVEAAVFTALEKLPADRFATAKEFADALDSKRGYARTVVTRPPAYPPTRSGALRALRALSALALTAIAAALAGRALRSGPDAPVSRYAIAFPGPKTPNGPMALTADGSRLVYRGPADSADAQLWLKDRDRAEATPIPGTANAIDFAISPDGRSLAVLVDGRLETMPIAGGPVTVLSDSAALKAVGPVWLDDGTIIYSSTRFRLMRVSAAGGAPALLYAPDEVSVAGAVFPSPLPGGRGVLFVACSVSCIRADLMVLDFKSGQSKAVLPGARRAWLLPTGHLVYVNGTGDLFAADFDLKTLGVRGSPVQVQGGVASPDGFAPAVAISGTGTLLLREGNAPQGREIPFELVWVDRAGQEQAVDSAWNFRHSAGGGNVGWSLSPDGRQVAIGMNTNSGDNIWLKRLPNGPLSRVTFESASEQRPRWTPDGQSLTYIVIADSSLHQRRADGTGADRTLARVPGKLITAGAWSPDGKWLVLRTGGIDQEVGGRDVMGIRPGIDTAAVPLAASTRFDEAAPMVSPDSKWLAYESDETGQTEVYIRPFPNVDDGRWQVSLNGGQAPLWAHNGKEIFFVDADRNMVAVPITSTAPLQLGDRRILFRMGADLFLTNAEHYTPFDISTDDKRFLMARRIRDAAGEKPSFLLVENWFTELTSKVAAK